ncbi:hypothetical protein B0H14DRAFT_2560614 [Mycena olivaceomarginata]|nr:hypothetical protein B0H14DRAFT_2560614 [Mycena olivaceomarginata]
MVAMKLSAHLSSEDFHQKFRQTGSIAATFQQPGFSAPEPMLVAMLRTQSAVDPSLLALTAEAKRDLRFHLDSCVFSADVVTKIDSALYLLRLNQILLEAVTVPRRRHAPESIRGRTHDNRSVLTFWSPKNQAFPPVIMGPFEERLRIGSQNRSLTSPNGTKRYVRSREPEGGGYCQNLVSALIGVLVGLARLGASNIQCPLKLQPRTGNQYVLPQSYTVRFTFRARGPCRSHSRPPLEPDQEKLMRIPEHLLLHTRSKRRLRAHLAQVLRRVLLADNVHRVRTVLGNLRVFLRVRLLSETNHSSVGLARDYYHRCGARVP